MAPVLLLIFGQGNLGIAVIAAIVVLFPALVNIVLGLASATPQALDVIRVNGGSDADRAGQGAHPVRAAAVLGVRPDLGARRDRGRMLAEWLVGFDGMGGVLSGYKGAGNYGGVWTIVALSVLSLHRAVRGGHHGRGRGAGPLGSERRPRAPLMPPPFRANGTLAQ